MSTTITNVIVVFLLCYNYYGDNMKKAIYVFLSLLVLTGCTEKPIDKVDSKKDDEKPIVEEKKLKIMDYESNERPIAIMINNHPKARPNHAGLQDAYLIYEIIVEGGFTRYLALFKDQSTARIGSVRSARPYFLDYAIENDAIYIHFGGSSQAISDTRSLKMNSINFMNTAGSFRDRTLGVALEHTAFTKMEDLKKVIAKKKFKTETTTKFLSYSVDEINLDSETIANTVKMQYSSAVNVEYNYNLETKLYDRKVNGVLHKDGVTKQNYTFKNIIVYKAENYAVDSYGRQALRNIGKFEGYYITNGKATPILIEKTSRTGKTTYKYLDGKEIVLNDGNTFVQIIPKSRNIEIS